MFVLEITHLIKRYGNVQAVSDVSLTVRAGEIVGLLGPNGAGKSTTIRAAVGLVRPDSGQVRIGGRDLRQDPIGTRAVLGYLPDVPNLYPRLTGWETLDFIGDAYRLAPTEKVRRAEELVDLFGLADVMGKQVETYSHGTQQKLAWAMALLHDPQLLILDEPTVGLDPANSRLIRDVLGLLRGRGCAILLSSHLLRLVEEVVDRIAMMQAGRLVATGTLAELQAQAGTGDGRELEELFLTLTGQEQEAADLARRAAGYLVPGARDADRAGPAASGEDARRTPGNGGRPI